MKNINKILGLINFRIVARKGKLVLQFQEWQQWRFVVQIDKTEISPRFKLINAAINHIKKSIWKGVYSEEYLEAIKDATTVILK